MQQVFPWKNGLSKNDRRLKRRLTLQERNDNEKNNIFRCCISAINICFAVSDFLPFYFTKVLTRATFLAKSRIWQKKVIRNVTTIERSKNEKTICNQQ